MKIHTCKTQKGKIRDEIPQSTEMEMIMMSKGFTEGRNSMGHCSSKACLRAHCHNGGSVPKEEVCLVQPWKSISQRLCEQNEAMHGGDELYEKPMMFTTLSVF